MTDIQLKKMLWQLHAARIEASLLEECLETSKNNPGDFLLKKNSTFKIIEETLNILNQKERLIIETHVIRHHTWAETMVIFSEKNGQGYERSERTLKRIQSSALKKMVDFINQSSLKEYFHE